MKNRAVGCLQAEILRFAQNDKPYNGRLARKIIGAQRWDDPQMIEFLTSRR
jgi:hypothetical protein